MVQLKADEREEVVADIKRYAELVKAYEDAGLKILCNRKTP